MDKKAKKRIDLLNKKMVDIQQRLAGARKQMDDASEVQQLEERPCCRQSGSRKAKSFLK